MSDKVVVNPFTGDLMKVPNIAPLESDINSLQNSIINHNNRINNNDENIILNAFRIAIIGNYTEYEMTGKTVDEYENEDGIDIPNSTNITYRALEECYQVTDDLGVETKLLLHGDGVESGTIIIDSSSFEREVTDNGVITTQLDKKFGTASLSFDGISYMSVPDSDDFNFGSDNFTIDFWFKFNSLARKNIMGQMTAGAGAYCFIEWGEVGQRFTFQANGVNYVESNNITDTTSWHHFAVVRNGNTITIYIDGVTQNSIIYAGAYPDVGSIFSVGQAGVDTGNRYTGLLDEIRVSKGIARWTTDFTPPLAPYGGVFGNMNLLSKAKTISSAPSTMGLVIREEDVSVITLNTDIIGEVSRDNGITWTAVILSEINNFDNISRILSGQADVSGQPSGTQLRYRVLTANNKNLKIHGVARLWN